MSSDSHSLSSRSSKPTSEQPIRFRRIRRDFTEYNMDYDQPFAIPDPLYVHTWEKYPEFVEKLIRSAGAPPPSSGEAGPSGQSTSTTTLPSLPYPIEQALAALMAGFDLERQNTERRVEEINDTLAAYGETRSKVVKLEDSATQIWKCHNNVANGVIRIEQRQDGEIAEIKKELQKLKAKREKDKKRIKALEAERAADKAEIAAMKAEQDIITGDLGNIHQTEVTMQHQIGVLTLRVDELEEPEEEEPEEEEPEEEPVEEDFLELNDLLDPMEQDEAEPEPEVIDP